MPHDSIVKILEMVKPAFMKNLIGAIHVKKLLSTEESCVIRNLIDFIKESTWNEFPEAECDVQISKDLFPKPIKINKILRYLTKKCTKWMSEPEDITEEPESMQYPNMDLQVADVFELPNCNHVIQTLYVTLEAYLDAYSVRNVQETLDSLNEKLVQHDDINVTTNTFLPELTSYTVSEQFIKKYRTIYQSLKELVLLLQGLKSSGEFPAVLKVFENIDVLDF